MKRSTGIGWGKLQVGILIMGSIAALMYVSFAGGGTSIFDAKGTFIAYFKNVNGLVKGSPIWMNGVEVGNVSSLKFEVIRSQRMVRVKCKVQKDIWEALTDGARVRLGSIGFLGDKYIEIIPGEVGLPVIVEGGTIQVKNIGSAPEMFKAGREAFEDVGSVVGKLDTLLGRMSSGEGTLGRLATDEELYTEMTKLLTSLTKLSASLQQNQERVVGSIEQLANSVGNLTDQVNENQGTIARLINDPALYDNLNATSARLDSVFAKVNNSEGNMGLLVNDTALYVELTNLLARANNLITDIEKDPRKYFKFSVF